MDIERKTVILDNIEFDYYVYSDGRCQNKITNNYLKGSIVNGYKNYYLRKGKIQKNIGAHRLVALMFLDNPDNLSVVCHIDGNKLNNNITNLQWTTYSESAKKADHSFTKNKRISYKYYTEEEFIAEEKWEQYHDTHLYFSDLGRLRNMQTNRLLKLHFDKNGYGYYSPKLNGKTKKILAHRGVYESFNKISLTKEQQIDHIDGNRNNNSLSNLRLCSAKDNCKYRSHKIIEGYDFYIVQFDKNGNFINYYLSQEDAAKAMGVTNGSISNAVTGKTQYIKGFQWKKISKQEVQRLLVMNVTK